MKYSAQNDSIICECGHSAIHHNSYTCLHEDRSEFYDCMCKKSYNDVVERVSQITQAAEDIIEHDMSKPQEPPTCKEIAVTVARYNVAHVSEKNKTWAEKRLQEELSK